MEAFLLQTIIATIDNELPSPFIIVPNDCAFPIRLLKYIMIHTLMTREFFLIHNMKLN